MYYWKPFNKRRLTRFYAQFIHEGDLCFDIGAHLGNRTNAWVALGANVIAVEPQPYCLDFLRNKFHDSDQVSIIPKAISDKKGELTLHVSQATPTISTAADEKWRNQINSDAWYEVKWEEQILVEAITLDDLIAEYGVPAFCKIDVENYEAQVLRGLTQPLPSLSFEYYPPAIDNALECFEVLEELARYEYNYSFGESQQLQSDRWISASEMLEIMDGFSLHKHYGDVYARLPG
jgi:FkbM family methyltransferase